ncbi:MAG: DNA mismatch repair endonuclease MutL [Desulfobacterales bacterium]|nr:DNA mismatch repair endonuclease MutL [Desulfobacterales bacterium]
MARIRILPDILANKIAAGEVVERPASVVKELVENALDAGADRIVVEIENGGRALIQVADNGAGMGRDDALLALERFATSKLHSDDDLAAIRTLGFRGEALPSIAAVSKLTLTTREPDADSGTQVRVEGGKILQVTEAGAAPGTMIQVAQLFFNTPARRKFLKSTTTETAHIADTVAGMALGYPQVHFKLLHNAKTVKQWPKVGDPAVRAADVLALSAAELISIAASDGDLSLSGVAAPARQARATSRSIYLFVNGRRVRDRVMQHALLEGFHGRLMTGQFPLAALFLTLPCDQVDVNVHPTKHEIRFLDSRRVHALVQAAVTRALAAAEKRLWAAPQARDPEPPQAVAEPAALYSRTVPPTNAHELPAIPTAPTPTQIVPTTSAAAPAQQPLWAGRRFADLTVIGQFRGTYLICQDGDDLILIDQHAAHERIVYEALGQKAGRIEAQHLLLPETVELSFGEAALLIQLIPGLAALGLEIEPFGGNTFVVKSLPTLLGEQSAEGLVRSLVERNLETGLAAGLDRAMDECRRVMACHRAVRANQRLNETQIRHLLLQLDQCPNASHCPHGRPTWIRWTLRELEKAFGRTGTPAAQDIVPEIGKGGYG